MIRRNVENNNPITMAPHRHLARLQQPNFPNGANLLTVRRSLTSLQRY